MKTNEHLAGTEGETGAQPYRLVGKWVIARGAGEFLADCFFGDKNAREASEHAATLLAACNSHAANLARIAEIEAALRVAMPCLEYAETVAGAEGQAGAKEFITIAISEATNALKGTK